MQILIKISVPQEGEQVLRGSKVDAKLFEKHKVNLLSLTPGSYGC